MRGVTKRDTPAPSPILFQPALPMRGVTERDMVAPCIVPFQPALPMRGVTRSRALVRRSMQISTRTPHAGSDRH